MSSRPLPIQILLSRRNRVKTTAKGKTWPIKTLQTVQNSDRAVLVPFIFFFGFSFYCGVKDGNIAGSIVAFAIMTFFLTKFLHPKPRKPKPYYPPHKNSVSCNDRYDEGFDEGLAAGFFMAESMRQTDCGHDGSPASVDADAYEEWDEEDC